MDPVCSKQPRDREQRRLGFAGNDTTVHRLGNTDRVE
jgi:hypothetical protein